MSSENLVELDDANWEKTLEMGDRPVAVMFSSPTCPYCKQMESHFNQYASDHAVFPAVTIKNTKDVPDYFGSDSNSLLRSLI